MSVLFVVLGLLTGATSLLCCIAGWSMATTTLLIRRTSHLSTLYWLRQNERQYRTWTVIFGVATVFLLCILFLTDPILLGKIIADLASG